MTTQRLRKVLAWLAVVYGAIGVMQTVVAVVWIYADGWQRAYPSQLVLFAGMAASVGLSALIIVAGLRLRTGREWARWVLMVMTGLFLLLIAIEGGLLVYQNPYSWHDLLYPLLVLTPGGIYLWLLAQLPPQAGDQTLERSASS